MQLLTRDLSSYPFWDLRRLRPWELVVMDITEFEYLHVICEYHVWFIFWINFDNPLNNRIRSIIYLKWNDICIYKMFELSLVQSPVCPKLWVSDIVKFETFSRIRVDGLGFEGLGSVGLGSNLPWPLWAQILPGLDWTQGPLGL